MQPIHLLQVRLIKHLTKDHHLKLFVKQVDCPIRYSLDLKAEHYSKHLQNYLEAFGYSKNLKVIAFDLLDSMNSNHSQELL